MDKEKRKKELIVLINKYTKELISIVEIGNIAYFYPFLKKTCVFYKIELKTLIGKNRDSYIVNARRFFFYYIKKHTKISYSEIGKLLNRDHSTAMYHCNKMVIYLENEKETKKKYEKYEKFMDFK